MLSDGEFHRWDQECRYRGGLLSIEPRVFPHWNMAVSGLGGVVEDEHIEELNKEVEMSQGKLH